MITIHSSTATSFDSMGLGALIPSACTVTEELNGLFELKMEHPYDEWGKWEKLENGRILWASTPRGKQAFRIYNVKPTMDSITVNAKHIFYDLLDNFIRSCTITSKTPAQTLALLQGAFNYATPFTFSTTLSGTGSFTVKNQNPVAALLNGDDSTASFVQVFGGEILRDNYAVAFMPTIGSDRGVSIRYSKNLVGLTVEEDISEVCTRIFPVGADGLQGTAVDSDRISDYPYPKARVYEDSSLTTTAQLTAWAESLFEAGADIPTVNIQADFQLLGKTQEYKDFAVLEDVQLGDLVTVSNTKMGFAKKASVISYEWDCLLDQYNKVELGDFVADITSSITSGQRSYEVATGASTEARQILSLISGYITITDNKLYICVDNADYTAATKLFRWSSSGLQYSSTGYNGTWSTIINSDGQIV